MQSSRRLQSQSLLLSIITTNPPRGTSSRSGVTRLRLNAPFSESERNTLWEIVVYLELCCTVITAEQWDEDFLCLTATVVLHPFTYVLLCVWKQKNVHRSVYTVSVMINRRSAGHIRPTEPKRHSILKSSTVQCLTLRKTRKGQNRPGNIILCSIRTYGTIKSSTWALPGTSTRLSFKSHHYCWNAWGWFISNTQQRSNLLGYVVIMKSPRAKPTNQGSDEVNFKHFFKAYQDLCFSSTLQRCLC